MSRKPEDVIEQAMELGSADRLLVAETLLKSIDETSEHREKWDREIDRRIENYRSGVSRTFSPEEVRERIASIRNR